MSDGVLTEWDDEAEEWVEVGPSLGDAVADIVDQLLLND